MMKKILLFALVFTLLSGALAGCSPQGTSASPPSSGETAPVVINFPTAGSGGALYAVGAAITNLWNQEISNVSASASASEGGLANLTLVSEGEAQVSVAISSNCYQCLNGTDSFEGHAYGDLKVIAGLYFNPNQVVVTESSHIARLDDIKGRRFAVGPAGSSVYGECVSHFTASGLKFPEDIHCEYLGFSDAADLLQNGTLDGAWIMSGTPAAAVTQACSSGCRLVEISGETTRALQAQYPWYAPYTIPAGTYPNQDQDIQTSAVKMVMFCRGDLDEEIVYQLTRTFWENIDTLGQEQASLRGLTPEEAVQDIAGLPLHPGAQRYYRQIGIL